MEEEKVDEKGERYRETLRRSLVEVTCVGGVPPPQRKTKSSQDSHLKMRTCCCR